MNVGQLLENLTNPALLFFLLGILAVQLKSDLRIPDNSSKFISIYLLLSIGFKGGQELSHSPFSAEIGLSMSLGILLAFLVPILAYYIIRTQMTVQNSAAIAAAYGSVSAVTFVTAISFLEMEGVQYSGHMIAVMALMEAPAIVVGVLLIRRYDKNESKEQTSLGKTIYHSITNGSVLLILGSLVIGYLASAKQAEGIKPFTTDIFKGFLAVFLLDMGITSGKHLNVIFRKGIFPFLFAALMPFLHGTTALFISFQITDSPGNQLLFAILGAGASYIAVPAALRLALPDSNSTIPITLSLGITFPFNISLGLTLYLLAAEYLHKV